MKLLHVVPTYLPARRYGGAVRSAHGLARALVQRGHSVSVYTTDLDGPDRIDAPLGRAVSREGVDVHYFAAAWARPAYSPAMARALSGDVGRFDLVHLQSVFLWPTWAAARACRRAGIPYVVSPRGMLVSALVSRKNRALKRAWLALVERANVEGAAALHATSRIEAEELRRFGWRLPPVFVVPNGIDAPPPAAGPASRAVEEALAAGPCALFLGRVNWKKGLEPLIAAVARVTGLRLLVAGNDEEGLTPQLRRVAAEQGAAERVLFLGPVEGDDKWRLLSACRVFVLPSLSENFGNAVLEAMAAGLPVLVTPEVGLADEVERSGAGLVLPADVASLSAGLARLLGAPGEAREMGRRGRQAVEERYGWPRVAEQMEQALARVLHDAGGGTADAALAGAR